MVYSTGSITTHSTGARDSLSSLGLGDGGDESAGTQNVLGRISSPDSSLFNGGVASCYASIESVIRREWKTLLREASRRKFEGMMDVSKDSMFRISSGFRSEPDRSAAILAASLLDDQLKLLLEKFLVADKNKYKMFASYAPLSTFLAKSEMAYLLALIPKDIRDDIDFIRKIRNFFAHRIEGVAFNNPPVSDFVMNLKTVQWVLDNHDLADKPISQSEIGDITKSTRRRFEIAVAIVSLALDEYIDAIEPLTVKSNEWVNTFLRMR